VTDEFSRYRRIIEQVSAKPKSDLLSGSSAQHGAIIVSALFRRAQQEVLISADSLNSPSLIEDEVLASLRDFLRYDNQRTVRILARQDTPRGRSLISELPPDLLNRVHLRVWKEKPMAGEITSFVVADQSSYRLERGHNEAIAQFGGEDIAERLSTVFDAEFSRASIANASADISISSLIVPESKATEGLLIRSTGALWSEIVRSLGNDWSQAYTLSASDWEEIVAGAFKRARFDEVILTPWSRDHGRDVIATRRGVGCVKIIGSVKAYSKGNLVSYDDVRALMGVLSADLSASKGIVATTSDFPPLIEADPFIRPLLPTRLELMNGRRLQEWLSNISNDANVILP